MERLGYALTYQEWQLRVGLRSQHDDCSQDQKPDEVSFAAVKFAFFEQAAVARKKVHMKEEVET
jgi:hypothetical protein